MRVIRTFKPTESDRASGIKQTKFGCLGVRAHLFSAIFLVGLPLTFGCTSTPRGTPASTKAAYVATDAVAVATSAIALAGGHGPLTLIPSNELVSNSTRVELTVTGLMSCASLVPRDIIYEILDGALRPLASGVLSQKWEGVTNAVILKEKTYSLQLRSQRSGRIVWQQSLKFSDEAPWKIFVPLECPKAS